MALEVQKYFMKKMFQIGHTETVRPSLKVRIGPGRHGILCPLGLCCRSGANTHFYCKEIADDFCNLVVSRLKRKETANVLLIGSPGNGKNFIIKKETTFKYQTFG